jgi:uncharacterized protein (DUF1501 family)
LRQQVAKDLAEEMQRAGRGATGAQGFEAEARRMAHMMSGTYRIGFVDVAGWDTHVNQGAAQGALANNLTMLGRGLGAFAEELGEEWRNTIVVVISEFGRTFRENGNRGTDHGHGSVYWVLGGSIRGGRIAGEQVKVAQSTLFQDRDFPVLTNYRALLGGLFQRVWGLSPAQLAQVFPQAQPLDLRLI